MPMQGQRYNRSKSFPEKKRVEDDHTNRYDQDASQCRKHDLFLSQYVEPDNQINSLKQEILELEKKLQSEFDVRNYFKKALGSRKSSQRDNIFTHKDLLLCNEYVEPENRINSLKQEILELEEKLQNEFDGHNDLKTVFGYRKNSQEDNNFTPKLTTKLIKEITVLELEISRLEQSISLLYRNAPSSKQESSTSPNSTYRRKYLNYSRTYEPPKHENLEIESRCFSFDNRLQDTCSANLSRCQSSLNKCSTFNKKISPPEEEVSKKEHYINRSSIGIRMTPNKLSEEMVKFASDMYCKITDTRYLFTTSDESSAFDVQLEPSGPYSRMIEVSSIKRKGLDFEIMCLHFRLLIKKLEDVDPRKLTHEEKLAFWINVHNALVMHRFVINGIPQNNGKRFLLLSKPAYNIGGGVMSIETIQNFILLLTRLPHHEQWLWLILTPKKLRTGNNQYRGYSLEHPEPLLYFALCSGNHSDPPIRVYTPKCIYLELETAKEEYIRATFGFRNDNRVIYLPKIIESFSKDSGLNQGALTEMIEECLSEPMKKTVKNFNMVKWIPHKFGFRYLIARELIK